MINTTELIELDRIDKNHYRAYKHQENYNGALFGGQLLTQSIIAVSQSSELSSQCLPHSLQAYFIAPGNNKSHIDFKVNCLKNGRNFSLYQVDALQNNRVIFCVNCSFHQKEEEFLNHRHYHKPPQRLTPKELADLMVSAGKQSHLYQYNNNSLFELMGSKQNPIIFYSNGENRCEFWLKNKNTIEPLDQLTQRALLAAGSDMGIIFASLSSKLAQIQREHLKVASLSHSLWFHGDVNMNNWHYILSESVWAAEGRALVNAHLYDEQGNLIATMVQEGSIRHSVV